MDVKCIIVFYFIDNLLFPGQNFLLELIFKQMGLTFSWL